MMETCDVPCGIVSQKLDKVLEQSKIYTDNVVKSAEEKYVIRLEATKDAVNKAETALTYRLEQMNEIREQLRVQKEDFATKGDMRLVEQSINALQKMVWIGVGMVLVVSLIFQIITRNGVIP